MKYIRNIILSIFLIGSVHGEQAKNPLIGEWELKKLEGSKADMPADIKIYWSFAESQIVVMVTSADAVREEAVRFSYALDMSKTPYWITADISDSLDDSKKDKRLGIFRIVGDELQIKWEVKDGGKRPTKFTNGLVAKYKRTKKTPAELGASLDS